MIRLQYVVLIDGEPYGSDLISEISINYDIIKKINDFKLDVNSYLDIISVWYRDILLFKATKDVNGLIFNKETASSLICSKSSFSAKAFAFPTFPRAKAAHTPAL